jgi:D-alanine-D-alanine ligase
VRGIGNEHPKASLPRIHYQSRRQKISRYTEKYAGTGNMIIVPALISEELTIKIQQMAVSAYRAIDASGLARVIFSCVMIRAFC